MYDRGLPLRVQGEATIPECFQHWNVFRQNLRDQFLQCGCTGNRSQVKNQCRAALSFDFIMTVRKAGLRGERPKWIVLRSFRNSAIQPAR